MQILGPRSLNRSLNRNLLGKGLFDSASLDLRFAVNKTLDPRVTFTRASTGTYVGGDGLLRSAVANEARFDHNPTTGESLGLLVEEARTNSIRNNTMVGAVAGTPGTNPTLWQYVTTQSNGLAVSVIGTGTESGINYIDYRFNGTTVASASSIAFGLESNAAAATGQTWTSSIYLRLVGGTTTGISSFQLGLIENNSGGSFVGGALYTIATPTNGSLVTQRYSATRTLTAATTALCVPTMGINVANSTAMDFTIRIGLPQLEQGAFATSVIPTTSATVTRAADVASITGTNFSSWYNQAEGTVFAEGHTFGGSSTNCLISIDDNTNNNRIQLRRNIVGPASTLRMVSSGGSIDANLTTGTALGLNKIAAGVAASNQNLASNGLLATGITSITPSPVVTQANIGNGVASTVFNGTIKRLTYWPVRLGNNVLQAITQ